MCLVFCIFLPCTFCKWIYQIYSNISNSHMTVLYVWHLFYGSLNNGYLTRDNWWYESEKFVFVSLKKCVSQRRFTVTNKRVLFGYIWVILTTFMQCTWMDFMFRGIYHWMHHVQFFFSITENNVHLHIIFSRQGDLVYIYGKSIHWQML